MKAAGAFVVVFVMLATHRPAAAQTLATPAEVGTFAASLEECEILVPNGHRVPAAPAK